MSAWNVLVVAAFGGPLLLLVATALIRMHRGARRHRAMFEDINAHVRAVLAQFDQESGDCPRSPVDAGRRSYPDSPVSCQHNGMKIVLTLRNGKRLR
ncbi:hypothetical protein [Actinocrispum wychmicini]|uniref:Uncharacterized protein n=1 Tax=Actinocrispum wychmicini TaxID=1213861 RepID=A0A4R2IWQ6_9PSEU|nr:hypothetical protein [Actinocrispum wychmicini]TCO47335.1 hypothetical protein EV192_11775 [Actinocrispum wychmicini]